MADGSVHFITENIEYLTYQRLGDRRDGEPTGPFSTQDCQCNRQWDGEASDEFNSPVRVRLQIKILRWAAVPLSS